MLVLTRQVDERIMIGDDIVITVVRVSSGSVRLGIDAPKDTVIRREELEPFRLKHSESNSPVSKSQEGATLNGNCNIQD
ncbi:MAG TPA: carbon storage regulator [Planctomicrobium sp.]|nr:carbon storage regulator [Planctomicrobium sp.]